MNATQQKRFRNIIETLESAKVELEALQTTLQDEYDNMSEAAQETEKGEDLSTQLDTLTEMVDSLDDVINRQSDV